MLSGILAAQPFSTTMFCDESLSSRPMDRVMNPFSQLGAKFSARDGRFPPLRVDGGKLTAMRMASAQECLGFFECGDCGLAADGREVVEELIQFTMTVSRFMEDL